MPGISTEYLAERIDESIRRQDEANNRTADEIHELGHKFDDFRVEVSAKLGEINANLKIAGRVVMTVLGVVISLIGFAIVGAWYAAKMDLRVIQLETRAAADPGAKNAK